MSSKSPSEKNVLSSEKNTEASADSASVPIAERQLGEIRDLLFGEQSRGIQNSISVLSRDMQTRMDALTNTMNQNIKQVREDFSTRLDELGRHVEQLNRHQENRIAVEHAEVDTRITSLRQDVERSDQTLERQLVDMSATLHELISTRVQEIMEQLTQTQLELRYSKADRKILASLLDKMANELNQDG